MHREEVIDELIFWMQNNINKPIKISDIAKKSGYSLWYFQRVFKEYTGETIGNFFTKMKLEMALDLLTTSNESIGEISYLVGFSSHQVFTRRFSQVYGYTPIDVRRRSLNMVFN